MSTNTSNIYLELKLSLDPAITDTAALKAEINRKMEEWTKLAGTDAEYQTLIGKAKMYLAQVPSNLQRQANDARNTQLQKLREEISRLSANGGLMQFEIQYLTKTYSCFQGRTVQEEIKKHSHSLIIGNSAAVNNTGSEMKLQSSVMETFSVTFDKIRAGMPEGAGKFISLGILAVLLIGVVLYGVCSLPRFFSGHPRSTSSYQRGVGPHIVKYANKDYNGKKWQQVESTRSRGCDSIIGWDKNNFCVYCWNYCSFDIFKNGSFTPNDASDDIRQIFYSDADTLYVVTRSCIRTYGNASYQDTTSSNTAFSGIVYYLQNDEYLFHSGSGSGNLLLLNKGILTEMSRQDVLKRFGQYFVDHKGVVGRTVFFRPHCAVAAYGQTISKCENDQWSAHYKTTHSGDVNGLWVLDFDNFVLVGGDITVFRDGKEFHPLVESGTYSFQRDHCQAVWGNSMNRFWVMDCTGCVAEFRDGKAGNVIVPGNFNRDINSYWVSPEGVVFVISDDNLYKLE